MKKKTKCLSEKKNTTSHTIDFKEQQAYQYFENLHLLRGVTLQQSHYYLTHLYHNRNEAILNTVQATISR